mmetsp:Transcript_6558/g.14914  ORF Transcript_6558/g.14914 Transcript_6558/m.14914 type:complete len:124 (+) Transcript_6558:370-741(+)
MSCPTDSRTVRKCLTTEDATCHGSFQGRIPSRGPSCQGHEGDGQGSETVSWAGWIEEAPVPAPDKECRTECATEKSVGTISLGKYGGSPGGDAFGCGIFHASGGYKARNATFSILRNAVLHSE